MARKEFSYRGQTVEKLKEIPMDDLIKLLPSRIRRHLKRGFTEQEKKLLARIRRVLKEKGETPAGIVIKTHCRSMPILPETVGLTFGVYNGKEFVTFEVKPEMVGHYLGEFALTRKPVKHSAPGIGATRSSLFVPVK